jgi:hypothetical protein
MPSALNGSAIARIAKPSAFKSKLLTSLAGVRFGGVDYEGNRAGRSRPDSSNANVLPFETQAEQSRAAAARACRAAVSFP